VPSARAPDSAVRRYQALCSLSRRMVPYGACRRNAALHSAGQRRTAVSVLCFLLFSFFFLLSSFFILLSSFFLLLSFFFFLFSFFSLFCLLSAFSFLLSSFSFLLAPALFPFPFSVCRFLKLVFFFGLIGSFPFSCFDLFCALRFC